MFSGMQLNDSQPGASPAAATQADARAEAGGPPAPPLTAAEAGGSSFSFMNGGAAEAAPSMSSGLAALGGMPGAAASPFAFMSQPEPSLAPAAPGPACGAMASLAATGKTTPVVRKKTSKARKPGWAADGTAQDGTAPPDGAVPPPAPSPTPAAAAAPPPRRALQLEHRTSGELHGLAPGHDERAPPRRGVGGGGEGGGGSCGSCGLDASGGFAGFAPPGMPPAPPAGASPGAPAGASPGERLRAMLGEDFIGLTGTPACAGGAAYGTQG